MDTTDDTWTEPGVDAATWHSALPAVEDAPLDPRRLELLAKATGRPRDTPAVDLINAVIVRLLADHLDDTETDPLDSRFGRAIDSLARAAGMSSDADPAVLMERAAFLLNHTAKPS
jgi:hypothetical protein